MVRGRCLAAIALLVIHRGGGLCRDHFGRLRVRSRQHLRRRCRFRCGRNRRPLPAIPPRSHFGGWPRPRFTGMVASPCPALARAFTYNFYGIVAAASVRSLGVEPRPAVRFVFHRSRAFSNLARRVWRALFFGVWSC